MVGLDMLQQIQNNVSIGPIDMQSVCRYDNKC